MKLIQLLASNDLNVPHDLSLVSFDNSSLSQIGVVPLTSITHPGKELGNLQLSPF
ncbi:MAG: substrate-binding domain-containing protein [Turicibacter sanguinis]